MGWPHRGQKYNEEPYITRTKHETGVPTALQKQPYTAGSNQQRFEDEKITKILEADVIEPSTAEWASPIVFAPRKDG